MTRSANTPNVKVIGYAVVPIVNPRKMCCYTDDWVQLQVWQIYRYKAHAMEWINAVTCDGVPKFRVEKVTVTTARR